MTISACIKASRLAAHNPSSPSSPIPTINNHARSGVSDIGTILILGGTTEASALARAFADRGIAAILSYAGRVAHPRAQPVPIRVGGFGGVDGLCRYISEHAITHLIDATHPFAATMSDHAIAAAAHSRIPYIALTRPPWKSAIGDQWQHAGSIADAVALLDRAPCRIMLALGRMHVDAFAAQPHHHYLLRFVDRPISAPALPDHEILVDRGPFSVDGDVALMQEHGINLVISKNAGGTGAEAKLIAARRLGIAVIMIDRPKIAERAEAFSVADVLHWLDHDADRGV